MADSGGGEWGKYAFTGVALLFAGGVLSVRAGYGLVALALFLAGVAIAVLWFVSWYNESKLLKRYHDAKMTAGESKMIKRDEQRGHPWMRVNDHH